MSLSFFQRKTSSLLYHLLRLAVATEACGGTTKASDIDSSSSCHHRVQRQASCNGDGKETTAMAVEAASSPSCLPSFSSPSIVHHHHASFTFLPGATTVRLRSFSSRHHPLPFSPSSFFFRCILSFLLPYFSFSFPWRLGLGWVGRVIQMLGAKW
ncbi:hypothetical protein PIB30_005743 [Stylosanthes scabra]|uniref:Secreted protein n=1 Tax=Stylosanthes scabra TaxID=79078 RepID=A0ABU6W7H8_9FABA|nr:hypothetical protein [Stylosanthes scabra]